MIKRIFKLIPTLLLGATVGAIILLGSIKSIYRTIVFKSNRKTKPESYVFFNCGLLSLTNVVVLAINIFVWTSFILWLL